MIKEVDIKQLNKVIQQQSTNILVRNNCLLCYAYCVNKKGETVCKLEYKQKLLTYYILGEPFEIPCPSSNCPKPKSRFFFNKCKSANII